MYAFSYPHHRTSLCIELISQLVFLTLLLHYLLYPPDRPCTWDSYPRRGLLLASFPLSFVITPRPLLNSISLLVPLAFLTSFPSVPLPGSLSFSILLWALVLLVLRLHFPRTPSPLFLLSHHKMLPFIIFLFHGLSQAIFPPVLLFLPAFLIVSFLLSFSLTDLFLKITIAQLHLANMLPSPAPMETRIAFLYLFSIIAILLISSVLLLGARPPLLSQRKPEHWDRYSPRVGHAARKTLLNAFKSYPGLYTFPPPFNIILLLVWIPRTIARFLRGGDVYGVQVERILWRCTVGPFTVLVTILCSGLLRMK